MILQRIHDDIVDIVTMILDASSFLELGLKRAGCDATRWRDDTKNDMFHALYGIGPNAALAVYEAIKSSEACSKTLFYDIALVENLSYQV
jgi:hypothetical protein